MNISKAVIRITLILLLSLINSQYAYTLDRPYIITTGIARKDISFLLVNPNLSDEKISNFANQFKNFGINGLILYEVAPNYGVLLNDKDIWLHPRNKELKKNIPVDYDIFISKEKIKTLVKYLYQNGIKVYYYDEMGANDIDGFNKMFAIYPPIKYPANYKEYSVPYFKNEESLNKYNAPIALYGGYGPACNPYTMKFYYAKQIEKLIEELDINGIFLDSFGWKCELASFGRLYDGTKINLSPDDICYEFIKEIKLAAKNAGKKDFKVLINMGFYPDKKKTYPKTSNLNNVVWVIEIPNYSGLKTIPLYPKIYNELNEKLKSEKESLIIFQPFFDTQNPHIYNVFLAIAVSNGLGIYHVNNYLGAEWAKSLVPVVEKFNKFINKYKNLFFTDKTNLNNVKVYTSSNIICNSYFVDNYLVINLINVDKNTNLTSNKINQYRNTQVYIENLNMVKNSEVKSINFVNQTLEILKCDYKDNKLICPIELKDWNIILIPKDNI